MANLQDVIERMKAEGDLTRNSGTNSLKQTNRILGEVRTELVEIGKSLGAIRTVGGLGGGQTLQVVGGAGGGGTASAATAPDSTGDPSLSEESSNLTVVSWLYMKDRKSISALP